MKTSESGLKLIKQFEGFRAEAYKPIPSDPWTIGYGFTDGVAIGDTITRQQAEARLRRELVKYEQGVMRATGGNVDQAQFDALVSFAFNVGVAGMAGSTVIKRHNVGDYQAAARAFSLWNKAGGRVLAGLTRRRAAEAALYLSGQEDDDAPRQVDPERQLKQSEIVKATTAAGATATVATVAEVTRSVSDIKYSVTSLADWIVPVLLIAVVGLCVYIYMQRKKQRTEGWS